MKSQFCAIAAATALSGCNLAEPRSEQYFSAHLDSAHLDEAKQIVADCATGTLRGDECYSAKVAVSKAKAKERTKKLGEKIKQH